MRPITFVTMIFLVVIAVAHLLRLAFGLEVVVQGIGVPMWVSAAGTIVPVVLAVGIWREHRKGGV